MGVSQLSKQSKLMIISRLQLLSLGCDVRLNARLNCHVFRFDVQHAVFNESDLEGVRPERVPDVVSETKRCFSDSSQTAHQT